MSRRRPAPEAVRHLVFSGLAITICLASGATPSQATEIGPDDDLCRAIGALRAGDELALLPGDYRGVCVVGKGGSSGAPIVIRAADPNRRPRILYPGRSANLLEIKGSHVILQGLDFGPTGDEVDAIRIFAADDVTVEDCRFQQVKGIAIVANHNNVHGLVVRRNRILDSGATAMYFGCHDGVSCAVTGLVVEGNHIQHVRAPDPEIGYGLEVKVNSSGQIRGNMIVGTKGPAIMVYGSQDLSRVSTIERNVVVGSRTSSGIVVGGGPAVVRNNVAVGNREAGIGLENYRGRGLLRSVIVAHNTVYDNGDGGIQVAGAARETLLVNNAVHARSGTEALPAWRPGLQLLGNFDCSRLGCFQDPVGFDFSPSAGSLLVGPGSMRTDTWMPPSDFFGSRRGQPPTVGAIERASRPIILELRP